MKKIVINCECNDMIDMNCGGEPILGFDFYTDKEDTSDLIEYIKVLLKKYNRPLMQLCCVDVVDIGYTVSNRGFIEKCIKEGY